MVSMSHPDDVARLREIKRLLDRIQRLPRLAGMPMNGAMHEPPQERTATAGPADGSYDGRFDRRPAVHAGAALGPPQTSFDLESCPVNMRELV
jgi:hypothetical protein